MNKDEMTSGTHRENSNSRSPNHSNRRTFLQGLGAAAAATLAGCEQRTDGSTTTTPANNGNTTATNTTEQTTQAGTYRRISDNFSTLDPIESTETASDGIIQNLFECLTNYPDGQTNVQNLIAKSVTVTDDVTYTFELKQGLTYSNGDEVTASDLVYSFERLAASDNSYHTATILEELNIKHETETVTIDGEERQQYKPGSLAIEAPDTYTFRMTLAEPFHAALAVVADTCFSAIPEGIVGDIDGHEGQMSHEEFTTNPVGSGPFIIETRDTGTSLELRARPMDEYATMEGPYVEGVHIEFFDKTNPAYTYATIEMNADHPFVPPSKYDPQKITIKGTDDRGREYGTYGPLENDLTAEYYRVEELTTYGFGFNCDNVPKFIRQAFAYTYNQQEVITQFDNGRSSPAYFFTPPAIFPGGATKYNELEKGYPYGHNSTQLNEARSLMEENGYGENNRYALTMTTYPSPIMKQIARLMKDKLEAAHITLNYEVAPINTLHSRAEDGTLECYSYGWIADYPAPDNFLKRLVPSLTQTGDPASVSSFDWGQAQGERGDASGWTEAARAAEDAWKTVQEHPLPTEDHKQKRNEAYLEIEKANWEDMVLCPAFNPTVEHFDYPWLNKPRVGAMGSSRQKWNRVKVGDRSQYKQ